MAITVPVHHVKGDPDSPIDKLLSKYGTLSRLNRQQVTIEEVLTDLLDLRNELARRAEVEALEADLAKPEAEPERRRRWL